MTKMETSLLATGHILIGLGLFYLHVWHLSIVFETKTNFSYLTERERELLFSDENAMYYSYYKALTKSKDVYNSFDMLLANNVSEYPNTINVMQKYHVYPEVFIGILYNQFMNMSTYYGIKTHVCYALDKNEESDEMVVSCAGFGLPSYFYLEFVWHINSFTIVIVYFYGTYLSHNILGGIGAAVFYFIAHDHATRAHLMPPARENFAFPFICWQIFYVTLCIEKCRYEIALGTRDHNTRNTTMIIKLTILNLIAILCWQFSTYVFATQTFIIFLMSYTKQITRDFVIDYTLSHMFSTIAAYYLMFSNSFFISSLNHSLVIALTIYSSKLNIFCGTDDDGLEATAAIGVEEPTELAGSAAPPASTAPTTPVKQSHQSAMMKARKFLNGLMFYFGIVYFVNDLTERIDAGFGRDNVNRYFVEMLLDKFRLRTPTFMSILNFCLVDLIPIDMELIKVYTNVFVLKIMGAGFVIFLSRWLHKRRNEPAPRTAKDKERIKNYVIEDFLEDNSVTMKDLADSKTDDKLKACMELLEDLDYDYEAYKLAKPDASAGRNTERETFLNDIKRLKTQISSEREQRTKGDKSTGTAAKAKKRNENESPPDNGRKAKDASKSPARNGDACSSTSSSSNSTGKSKKRNGSRNNSRSHSETEGNSRPNVEEAIPIKKPPPNNLLLKPLIQPHYLFNILQTLALAVLTAFTMKLKFLLTPFLCVFASTLPSKDWFPKSSRMCWTIYVILMICSIGDPGIQNLKKQYKPQEGSNKNLLQLIDWIDKKTEPNAVFAGPTNIVPSIMLSTGRPIFNNPYLEFKEMQDRTMLVYSVFSRKPPGEIYNQLAKHKIQYIVVTFDDCFLPTNIGYRYSDIWDFFDTDNLKNTQFCADLLNQPNPNFNQVFLNDEFIVLKIFTQSVQLELKRTILQEYDM